MHDVSVDDEEVEDDSVPSLEDYWTSPSSGRRRTVTTLPANAVDPKQAFAHFEKHERLERSRRANALLLANFGIASKVCVDNFMSLKKALGVDGDLDSVSIADSEPGSINSDITSHHFSSSEEEDDDDDDDLGAKGRSFINFPCRDIKGLKNSFSFGLLWKVGQVLVIS